ncbi:MAG: transcription termination factor Rho [Clostridia bacterium]|nr:transcription termination factor Rho [Clostridia bacterium]
MSENLDKMSVIELRQKAKELGVKLGAGINKQGIVDKLKEALAARETPAQPEQEQTTMETNAPEQESFARPIRKAAIITDDEEMDDDDVPVLTATSPRAPARMTARPVSPAAPAPGASSLSTISAKAPAFTMEGSRAWHNPRTYQTQNNNYQRPGANNSWQRPAQQNSQDQRGYSRPDPRAQQRPQQQPTYVNRFGPEQSQQPEPENYRGYAGAPQQQDYSGAPMNTGYNQGGYGYNQPAYNQPGYNQTGYNAPHREAGGSMSLSDILAAGDCVDGEGVLEVHPDGYGFLRTSHYLPGKQDVYISNAQIRRFSLRTGDYIVGKIRPQRDADRYSAMLYITEINGSLPDEMPQRSVFEDLTPIYPKKRMTLSGKKENDAVLRLIDLLCPIGFGQRAVICCNAKVDRPALMNKLAAHIAKNHSKAHLMLLLLDERPEEVTDIADSVDADLAYATFDETPENQIRAAELALERAMRLVEQKKDVVLLVDSLTRIAQACNMTAPATARTLNNGLAAGSLNKAKRFFGAARNTREGGSLTIIAAMPTETGNDLDTAIFQSFQGNGNMSCALSQQGQNQPVLLQPDKCATVHDEWLLSEKEQGVAQKLREMSKDLSPAEAMNALLPLFVQAETNDALEELLNKE